MIKEDPKSGELIKPLLRGRDINRYRADWNGLWLIDTHNGYGDIPPISIENYKAIKRHLDKFYPELEKRRDKGITPYNLRNCAYHAEFEKEKIIWGNLSIGPRFALTSKKIFISAPCNMLTGGPIKYLTAWLNSRLCHYRMSQIAYSREQGYMEYKKIFVEQLAVPLIVKANRRIATQLENLVDDILTITKDDDYLQNIGKQTKVKECEKQVDQLVYELHGLTKNEINIIEGIQ